MVAALRGKTLGRGTHVTPHLLEEARDHLSEEMLKESAKKFRTTNTFNMTLPNEKPQNFSQVLVKFFKAEPANCQQVIANKTPDYEGLLKKTGDKKVFDVCLRCRSPSPWPSGAR